jgi:transitional endoplasmic reticulum ATPase
VDTDQLVSVSDRLTPAEIEYVARAAAQSSFERDVVHGDGDDGPVTDDYLAVLARLRPTVTSEVLDEFGHDITSLSRM